MAFQTNVLRNGEWVMETVDVDAALRATTVPNNLVDDTIPNPGPCGLLSNTIVESPVVRKVLSVRLRSQKNNDIAFVGVS